MKSHLRLTLSVICVATAWVTFSTRVTAATFDFVTDPFAGSTALTTPGRQIVGGEPSISFSIPADIFSFNPSVFAIGSTIQFANGVVGSLPTSGVNAVVLRTFDNDANPATPFGAGNAADLIADRITTSGAGFFIYFNQGLDLPRLVYSTDLSDNLADLKILTRLTNLGGVSGQTAMATFAAGNFQVGAASGVPEPSSVVTLALAVGALMVGVRLYRRA